jgi:tRNA wybutosine-synthesizing protein 4
VSSDPLFWQCLSRYPTECAAVKFVDIDYKDLMLKKREIVQRTDELFATLSGVVVPKEGNVLLRSDQYLQLGCDLRDVSCLQQSLAAVLDIPTCDVLFAAEVSITYMNVDAADALIGWASTLPSG